VLERVHGDRARAEFGRLGKFVIVGVSNTLLGLGTYAALLALGVPYVLSGAIAWSVGTINGYTWNRLWTFGRARHGAAMASRYLTVGLLGLILNTMALAILVAELGAAKLPAELVALPLTVAVTFSLNRLWTFGSHIRLIETGAVEPAAREP
jgi:putative flippase GtrA